MSGAVLELGEKFTKSLQFLPKSTNGGTGENRPPFGIMTNDAFLKATFELKWLVDKVLVASQPAVVGGAQKTLKTSLCIALIVSLAFGIPFLGRFAVSRRHRVLFLSAESGGATLRETFRRICRHCEVQAADATIFWGTQVPDLGKDLHFTQLSDFIERQDIDIVIIDPFYLCLDDMKQAAQASNMFAMGPLLRRLSDACLKVNATPVFVHHTRKQGGTNFVKYDPPELGDLAFAGLQQLVRQWILLGRRKPFDSETGLHQLWLAYGGSVGHSRTWGLDIDEGRLESDFQGRIWKTQLWSQADLHAHQAEERETKRQAVQEGNYDAALQEVLKILQDSSAPLTQSDIKKRMSAHKSLVGQILAELLEDGLIEKSSTVKSAGRGTRPYEAYTAVSNCIPTLPPTAAADGRNG